MLRAIKNILLPALIGSRVRSNQAINNIPPRTARTRRLEWPTESMDSFRPEVEILEERWLLAVDYQLLPVLPYINANMQSYLKGIFRLGQTLGERANVFMKVGDSNSWYPDFLDGLGDASYNPSDPGEVGTHTNLASTIDYFRETTIDPFGANSFNHDSSATMGGWSSTVLVTPGARGVPAWLPGLDTLTPLDAELVQTRPAIALVMIGTVDVSSSDPALYQSNLISITTELLSHGIVPVLSTIPQILQPYPNILNQTSLYNQIIANVAQSLNVPLWNLHVGLDSLYHDGLSSDNLHLSYSLNGAEKLDDADTEFGMNYRNLTAVEVLQKIVGQIELNAPPDSPAVPAGPFLAGVYSAILQRPIDEGGSTFFTAELNAGVSPNQIVQQLWAAPEHRQMQIEEYYQSYLHRNADAAGLQYWQQQFAFSQDEFLVQVGFLNSQEFLQQHSTDASFVAECYQDILARQPGGDEAAYWTQALHQGGTRGWLAGRFALSAEAAHLAVEKYYENDLGRPMDSAGFEAALSLIGDGAQGYVPVIEMLLTSPEFLTKLPS